MLAKILKALPTILALLAVVSPAITPAVQGFWSSHPEASTLIASILVAVANFLPQPHK